MESASTRDGISRALDGLDATALDGYADRSAPDATDELVAELIRLLSHLTLGEREQILYGWFEPEQLQAFSVFAMRMCGLSVAERDPDLLRSAVVALAYEGLRDVDDERVGNVLLGTVADAAGTLAVAPADLVGPVLALANPEMADRLRDFFQISPGEQEVAR